MESAPARVAAAVPDAARSGARRDAGRCPPDRAASLAAEGRHRPRDPRQVLARPADQPVAGRAATGPHAAPVRRVRVNGIDRGPRWAHYVVPPQVATPY